ncbi:hypothetical protein ACHAWF_005331 [Thalassiosira exigua]
MDEVPSKTQPLISAEEVDGGPSGAPSGAPDHAAGDPAAATGGATTDDGVASSDAGGDAPSSSPRPSLSDAARAATEDLLRRGAEVRSRSRSRSRSRVAALDVESDGNGGGGNGRGDDGGRNGDDAGGEGEADDDDDDGHREPKRGHKYCFCLCDTKRAVVWLNTAVLLLQVFTTTAAYRLNDPNEEGYVKDMIVRGCGMLVTLTTLVGAYYVRISLSRPSPSCFVRRGSSTEPASFFSSSFPPKRAQYSVLLVFVGFAFTGYQLTVAIIQIRQYYSDGYQDKVNEVLLSLMLYILMMYAEGAFLWEVSDGIVSAETYKRRERYCCCFRC